MLRFIVLALLLLNGLYFAWSQGLLQGLGLAPAQQTEPLRLAQQIKPATLRLLKPQELQQPEAPQNTAAKPAECLQAGLFDEAQSNALRNALTPALPAGTWQLENARVPPRWIVFMGPYATAEDLAKKRSQLAYLNLTFEPLSNPALGLGLSLGGFETQAQANAAREALGKRGVRTARVVLERAEVRGLLLRLPAVDAALKTRLEALQPVLAGNTLGPCT